MTFERPTLTKIDARVRADIESTIDEVPIVRRGTILAGIARGLAGASHALHGHIDWVYLQIFPDTAESAQLERQAGFHGLVRAEPARSSGSALITGTNGTVLPAGSTFGHASGLEFVTTEAAVIAGGAAAVPIEAVEFGAIGNLDAAERLVFLSPVGGIGNEATIADPGLAGGADTESDGRLLDRLLLKLRRPAHGGAAHDYIQWAREIPGVTRVWVDGAGIAGLGRVIVRFAVDDAPHGPAPNEGEVAAVQTYLEQVRPVTAEVEVVAPILTGIDVTLSITPDTAAVREAVTTSLNELFEREGAPGEVILLTHIAEAISTAPGETDHALQVPAANVQPGVGEIPVLGQVTFA